MNRCKGSELCECAIVFDFLNQGLHLMQGLGDINLLRTLGEAALTGDAAVGLGQTGDAVEARDETLALAQIVGRLTLTRVGQTAGTRFFVVESKIGRNVHTIGTMAGAAAVTAVAEHLLVRMALSSATA